MDLSQFIPTNERFLSALAKMSELNQNNKRLSRLAIISEHVAEHRREHFGTVWDDFLAGGLLFLSVPVYSAWKRPVAGPASSTHPPPGLFMLGVALISPFFGVFFSTFVFDANGGTLGGLDELQMLPRRCLLRLTGDDEDFEFQENSAEGRCPAPPTPRCAWAPAFSNAP